MDLASPAVSETSVYANGLKVKIHIFCGHICFCHAKYYHILWTAVESFLVFRKWSLFSYPVQLYIRVSKTCYMFIPFFDGDETDLS